MADQTPSCANCRETAAVKGLQNLKACTRCKTTRYCGRDCQKADWKVHKKVCSRIATEAFARANTDHTSSYSAPRLRNLEQHVPNPFTRLDQNLYLHGRPETDVYKLLIDSFRMRQADDFDYEYKTTPPSVYTGAPSSTEPFLQYLAKATTHPSLLPPWFTDDKAGKCATFGNSGAWSDLRKKVTKPEIIQHYGDEKMPMQLRMLAEVVYGTGTMGQDGSGMRKLMMQVENDGSGKGQAMSHIDISR
ncbi:hypothetical protein BU25DRAFT_354671 [Macroventuria anomochaeta]|uniref:Uncharacterized protein n=1 Tax=Macroventuria anomochaeta TaxID=301207 RepID=A0ACB6RK31_9PLEO|nr:uncharacterized protein BU25DRAFT_354671 [Macroventuria anomochaeta]KAF2621324.1 hypothetical protein BU25DRAFT_354671 [Macroventuria anomochaeta]